MVLLVFLFAQVFSLNESNLFEGVEQVKVMDERKSELGHGEERAKMKTVQTSESENTIRISNSLYEDFYSESGAAVSNEDPFDIIIDRSFFMDCTADNHGGAIYSYGGLAVNISLCCFSQCNTLYVWGSAVFVNGVSNVINETATLKCGKDTSRADAYFSGKLCEFSLTNFSKSIKAYSASSFSNNAMKTKISYVNVAQCETSGGIALHINSCKDAFIEYTNVVNNTGNGGRY